MRGRGRDNRGEDEKEGMRERSGKGEDRKMSRGQGGALSGGYDNTSQSKSEDEIFKK